MNLKNCEMNICNKYKTLVVYFNSTGKAVYQIWHEIKPEDRENYKEHKEIPITKERAIKFFKKQLSKELHKLSEIEINKYPF